MRVLYVTRGKQTMRGVRLIVHRARDFVQYRDQDGFFEASLAAAAQVETVSLARAAAALACDRYDWLIVNWKQEGFANEEARARTVTALLRASPARTAVFVGAAQAGYLPPVSVLDACDAVIKREPYRCRRRYAIHTANQRKIIPTIISCPFVVLPKAHTLARLWARWQPAVAPCRPAAERYDVGFSGFDAAAHTLRREAWQRVVNENLSTIGGLQPHPHTEAAIPEALRGPRLGKAAYRTALCAARINLALSGIGQYTFRHQELLYLGKFMLCDASITELELPLPLVEGTHYAAFHTLDDMLQKIRYYLAHEEKRRAIAAAGRELFFKHYRPHVHGKALVTALQKFSAAA